MFYYYNLTFNINFLSIIYYKNYNFNAKNLIFLFYFLIISKH